MKRIVSIGVLALTVTARARAESPAEPSIVMMAVQDELARSTAMQLKGMPKPYYAAFDVRDVAHVSVSASLGKIVQDGEQRRRRLSSFVRVGDYGNDSGNFFDDRPWEQELAGTRETSLDSRYDPVRHDAWLAIDGSYKLALDRLAKKTAIRGLRESAPDRVDDFSHEAPTVLVDAQLSKSLGHERATRLARTLSGVSAEFPALQGASAFVYASSEERNFVSSEGARVVQPRFSGTVQTVLRAQADDGMQVSTYRSVATCSIDTLPSDESLLSEVKKAATELDEIRRAPVVEDYSGPILFEGVAAPELVYDVMASALSGMPPPVMSDESFRQRRESALVGQVGQRVLPVGFDLEDDPTIDHLGSLPLAGCYKVDDEGVPAQKVKLVENGIFKSFVMSRTPRKGFLHSNGHGRSSYDGISASFAHLGLAEKDLRARLIAEAKAQKKPYALIVERLRTLDLHDVDETWTESFAARMRNSGTKLLVVWKLELDGKTTRVRGGELGEVNVRSLKDILAAGSVPAVAGSSWQGGYSVTSPALLFRDLEVKKPREASKRPPILARPE